MTDYLKYQFDDIEEFINTFDELPLWSAAFGLLLLKHLELKGALKVIDIGSGAGFPLLELAGRLGKAAQLYGLDPWVNANNRARRKIKNYGLTNVEIMEQSAEQIPFENDTIDLIVSNLGINNFENPKVVFKECYRVLKPGGRLVLTTNLNGHWKQFYEIFETTLRESGNEKSIIKLQEHQEHRGSVETVSQSFKESGFKVDRYFEEKFEMKFSDGTAFLNHNFVKLGWLASWKEIVPKENLTEIFSLLETNLNEYSKKLNYLGLTVPMLYMEGKKV